MYRLEFEESVFESDVEVRGNYIKIIDKFSTHDDYVVIPIEELVAFVYDHLKSQIELLSVVDSRIQTQGAKP